TLASIRVALRERDVWVVGGFLFFYTFSPSFGPALLFYQTDVLHFSQQFIGHLSALAAVAAIGGAFIYAPLSRRMPLRRLINLSIGIAVAGTLAYLLYRDLWSALAIPLVFGFIGVMVRLGLLLCGTALFLGLLVHVGPRAVGEAFTELSWRLLIILVFPFGMTTLLDTLGWRFAFRRDRTPFTALLAARLAGEAFNLTT